MSADRAELARVPVAGVPVALVPGVLALLPEYASIVDPVAELRAACLDVVAGLGPRVKVVASASGARVARHLVRAAGSAVWPGDLVPAERAVDEEDPSAEGDLSEPLWCGTSVLEEIGPPTGVLVVANGSATRSEKAPGHFDEQAESFDDSLRRALLAADGEALRAVDEEVATELWADVAALRVLGGLLPPDAEVSVAYDAAPFGVQYWVISYR